jgi:hypothetical protein
MHVCVYLDVYERIRKFSECQTGSELLSFRARTPIEDAYRGRLSRTPTEDAPLFLGCFFPRSRSDGTTTDQGATFRAERMSARRREGDRGPGRSVACGDREDGRGDSWARGNETVYHIGFDQQRVDVLNMVRRIKESKQRSRSVGATNLLGLVAREVLGARVSVEVERSNSRIVAPARELVGRITDLDVADEPVVVGRSVLPFQARMSQPVEDLWGPFHRWGLWGRGRGAAVEEGGVVGTRRRSLR